MALYCGSGNRTLKLRLLAGPRFRLGIRQASVFEHRISDLSRSLLKTANSPELSLALLVLLPYPSSVTDSPATVARAGTG